MTQDEKLEEALKETFPASDAFYVSSNPASEAGSDLDMPHENPVPIASLRALSPEDPDIGRT